MAYPWKRSWKNYKEHSDHRHVNENLSEIKKKKNKQGKDLLNLIVRETAGETIREIQGIQV